MNSDWYKYSGLPPLSFMKTLVAASTLLFCQLMMADETNVFYPTDDGYLFQNEKNGSKKHLDSQKLEAAKTMRECFPAKDFPEGNWGEVKHGYQLSLRFNQPVYTNGDPIMATLLLRNVTNKVVEYASLPVGWDDGPIGFEVTGRNGQNIPQHPYTIGFVQGQSTEGVSPQTQVKFLERLDKRFDLTKDTYSVQANVRVGDLVSIPEVRPILDSHGKFKPIKDEHGSMTNVI